MNIPFLHPSDRDLVSVASGELSVTAQAQVSTHLASCQRCRSYVQDVRAMAAESAATEAPRASEGLFSRIVAGRAVGARVIIAGEDVVVEARRPLGPRRVLVPVGIAAVLVLSTLSVRRARTRSASLQSKAAITAVASTNSFEDGLSLWPSVASAQTLSGSREAPYRSVQVISTSRLQSQTDRYVFSLSVAPESLQLRPYAILSDSVERTRYGGTPAWRMTSLSGAYPVESRRTVLLSESDLHVLESRWETERFVQLIHVTDMSVVVRFAPKPGAYRDDSAGAARRIAVSSGELPRQSGRPLVIGDAGLRLLFRVMPLHSGWRGSVDVISYESPFLQHIRPIYVNLRVTNQLLVTSSYRRIPCWRVVVDAGGRPEYWYVSKESGQLVRAERKNENGSLVEVDRMDTRR
jgi:hypothetical protein